MLLRPAFCVSFSAFPLRTSSSCSFWGFSPHHVSPEEGFSIQLCVFSSLWRLRSNSSWSFLCFLLPVAPEECFCVQLLVCSSLQPSGVLHHAAFLVLFTSAPEDWFVEQLLVFSSLRPLRSSASSSFWGSLHHVYPEEFFSVQLVVFTSLQP